MSLRQICSFRSVSKAPDEAAWWSARQVRIAARLLAVALTVVATMVSVAAHPAAVLYPASATLYSWLGLMLWSRRPSNVIGPLLTATGIGFLMTAIALPFGGFDYLNVPRALTPRVAPIILGNAGTGAIAPLLILALLLFPDGKAVSRRWRWLHRLYKALTAIGFVAGLLADPGYGLDHPFASPSVAQGASSVLQASFPAFTLGLVAVFTSIRIRFRRGSTIERQQLKWLSVAVGAYVLFQIGGQISALANGGIDSFTYAGFLIDTTLATLVPAAILVAITRHRLYDIDRLISRSIMWLSVAAVVTVIYSTVVTAIPLVAGAGNRFAVAAATLVAAAAFEPLRRRISIAVDRRFNRAHFDAGVEIDALSRRMNESVDMEAIVSDALAVLARTVQPRSMAAWVARESSRPTAHRSLPRVHGRT